MIDTHSTHDATCGSRTVTDKETMGGNGNRVTFRSLSPGCRALEAGPSGCTLVTKIPYKSKVI